MLGVPSHPALSLLANKGLKIVSRHHKYTFAPNERHVCSALEGAAALLDDVCEAVEACSIPVEQVHAESGPGQFELATAPGVGTP